MWGKSAQAVQAGVGREDRDSKERVSEEALGDAGSGSAQPLTL